MARGNASFKGRIQKRKTNYLQAAISGLQRAAGPYRWAMKRREQVQRNCQCASTSRQKTHQAKADRAPRFRQCLIIAPRSSICRVNCTAPRTRRRSRPHGAHRGGLGQVNSAGRDVAEYNLERKRTSSTSSVGLPKRRAVDTYPCDALWLGPSWPCMSLDRYTQSTLNVARHAKKAKSKANRKPN